GVTYTYISSPFEELSDIGSPRADDREHLELLEILEDLYVEVALQDPPSHDYIPGPEEPEQASPSPDYSPEYVPESDLEVHPEDDDDEDPEEDPVDYLVYGRDNGDDEEGSSEDDEDDDMDIDANEEAHLALADSVVVASTAADQAPSAEETEPFETGESAATPPPHPAYRMTARIYVLAPVPMPAWSDSEVVRLLAMSSLPASPLSPWSSPPSQIPFLPLPPILSPPSPVLSPAPPPSPIRSLGYRAAMIRLRAEAASTSHSPPLPPPFILSPTRSDAPSSGTPLLLPISASTSSPPLQLPSASRREHIPEVTLPPRKRLGIALGPGYEVGESSSAATARPAGGLRADYGFIATMDRDIMRDPERERLDCPERLGYDRHMRQIVISELLRADHRRATEIIGLRTALQGQKQMEPKRTTRSIADQETINTTSVTNAQLQAMIDQGVTAALAARDALRSTKGDDSHNSGTGVRRIERATRECTYIDFLKCQPLPFKGTEGELALLCGMMFSEESNKIEKYIESLPDMIHGSVVASKPKTMQEAIEIATELMDKKIRTFAERETTSKRKFENTSRNTQNRQQQSNKRQNTGQDYTATSGEKKQYGGSKPLCAKCNYHHDGPCAPKCRNCNKIGHFARDCRNTANTNNANNQRGTGLGQKTTCYECEVQGHFQRECPKLKNNNNHGNQGGRNNAPARVYAVGRAGTDPDANVVTVIAYAGKIVRIPWGNETLIIHGDGSNQGNATRLSIISCTKTEKYIMKGFPIFLAHIGGQVGEEAT
nr:hypothetical protein [Tanacetum cinerariifolium]